MDYEVKIQGVTDLLMHCDSVMWADRIKAWMAIPENAKLANVKGDDRSPGFRFVGSFWRDSLTKPEGSVVIVTEALKAALAAAGAGMKGTGRASLKATAASGITIPESPCLLVRGKPIDCRPFFAMADKPVVEFEPYAELALKSGFVLDVRRAPVGASKHIRVRPRFGGWSATVHAMVNDPRITKDVLRTLFSEAGAYKGLGDWRPSSRKPGRHGIFTVTDVREV